MSAYTEALRRHEQAADSLRAAQKDRDEAEAYLTKAQAEWAVATRELRKFEIDPEYDPSRKLVAA